MATLTVVRAPGVGRTLAVSLLARVPLGALGLLLVLRLRDLGHSYALAGACSGACALGIAAGAPLLGRAADRVGQRPVLLASGAAAVVSAVAFALLPAHSPSVAFLATAAAFGMAQPPVGSCVRVLWQRLLDAPAVAALLVLDASLQEVALVAGPLVLVSSAALIGPAAALIATGALLAAAAATFAYLPETRAAGGPQAHDASDEDDLRSPFAVPGVRTLLGVAGLLGFGLGATELTLVRFAEWHGATGATALLFACWGAGSLIGGIAWARRSPDFSPAASATLLLGALGVSSAVLVTIADLWMLSLALVVPGMAIAPLFGLLYSLMAQIAPPRALTEAFAWETSAVTSGLAAGSTAAGALAGGAGRSPGFALAAGGFLLALGFALLRRATLTPAEQRVG